MAVQTNLTPNVQAPLDAAPAPVAASTGKYPFLGKPDANRDLLLADQLHHRLVGGPPSADSPYSMRELRLYVQEARDYLESERIRKNKEISQADFITRQKLEKESWADDIAAREAGATPDEWIQTFPVLVKYDATTEEQYCDIPPAFLNLRRYQLLPGEGGIIRVQHVTLTDRRKEPGFMGLANGMDSLLDGGLACGLLGHYGFRQEGSRLLLYRERGQAKVSQSKVLLSGIVRGSRTSNLPEAPLKTAIDDWEVLTIAYELATKPKREDKLQDQSSLTL